MITLQTPMVGPVDCSAASIMDAISRYPHGNAQLSTADIQQFADAHVKWSNIFGRRTSIVVAQTLHETGYLRFGGDVLASQHNFGGLAATGGVRGASFDSVDEGVCAVYVHHMPYEYGAVDHWPAAVRQYAHLDERIDEVLSAGYGGVVTVIGDYTNSRWAYTKTIPVGSLANGYAQAMVDGANELLTIGGGTTVTQTDDSVATWQPSPNYGVGRDGKAIEYIILHTTEGSYDSALGWLRNPKAQASCTYLASADGSRVAQLVREADTSWGAGNLDYNQRGVNIEQEGHAAKGGFSDGLYQTVGALVGRIAQRHNIPLDRAHVIGHMDVPDPNNPALEGGIDHHRDPGPHYDFDRVIAIAKGGTMPAQPVTDPNVYTDPVTGYHIIGGMYARWGQLRTALASISPDEVVLVVGHAVSNEEKQTDGSIVQRFEHQTWRWRHGQSPERFDILADIINPYTPQP